MTPSSRTRTRTRTRTRIRIRGGNSSAGGGKSSKARGPILVTSAFGPELAPLRSVLGARGIAISEVVTAAAGIGAVDAAVGAAARIAAVSPRLVLFIGTAGSYGATPPLGEVAIARRLFLTSTAAVRGDGYVPPPMVLRQETDGSLRRALVQAALAMKPPRLVEGKRATASVATAAFLSVSATVTDVVTPLAITTSRALARRLAAATGAGVENLEAFAVGRAAARAGIPFAAVLGISNRVGPTAHAEWVRHQRSATRAATLLVEQFVLAALKVPNRSPARARGQHR